MLILVDATEHPTCDAWVDGRAADWAAENHLAVGDYLGREDVIPPRHRSPDMCGHVFTVVGQPGLESLG